MGSTFTQQRDTIALILSQAPKLLTYRPEIENLREYTKRSK